MEILTRITGGWLTFKDLEKALDVPAVSLRRYHEKFPTYLVGKKVNRSLAFPRESIEVFKLIYELYKEGLDTATVQATLAMHFAQTHDIQTVPKDTPPPPTPDRTSPPALPDTLGQLLPLAERFVSALETIAARMTVEEAPNRPFKSGEHRGDTNPHPERETGQDGQDMRLVKTREEIIAEVHRLRGLGYGAARIRTTLVKAGWPSLAGPGHRLSKSTVARIVKGEISN